MIPRWLVPDDRWTRVVVGTFLVLLGILATDAAWDVATGQPYTWNFFVGVLTTLPFIFLIGYVGRWLTVDDVPVHRHRRVALWMLGGLVGFLCINLLVMTIFPSQASSAYVGWARWAAALGGGAGSLIGMFEARAIDRELTAERERVTREKLATKNDRLEEFATILSHDLRSPLNVASGNIDLAARSRESDRLDTAARALSRMDEIIEETLLLARSGQVIGETERIDLRGFAADCWRNVDTADATLHVDDPPTVAADADRLRHLFENVFRNCVVHGSTARVNASRLDDTTEHGTSGSRSLTGQGREGSVGSNVSITVGACPGGFFVEDDGPGIPDADRESVFEAGFSTANEGNGFGLAIVQQIAEAHGWTVAVAESEAGGARFEFTGVEPVD